MNKDKMVEWIENEKKDLSPVIDKDIGATLALYVILLKINSGEFDKVDKGECLISAETLNNISSYCDGWVLSLPKFFSYDELDGFEKQDCELSEFEFEYIRQSGCADFGFTGTIGFPINKNTVMLIDYTE